MTIKMFMILIVLLQMFMSMMTMALTKTMTMTIRMARAFLRRGSSEVKNRALGEMLCAPVIGKVKAWGDSLAWGSALGFRVGAAPPLPASNPGGHAMLSSDAIWRGRQQRKER